MPLPTFDEAKAELAPDEYRRLLQTVSLNALSLDALGADLKRDAITGDPIELRFERDIDLLASDGEAAELLMEYTIRGLVAGRQALRIKASYRLSLEVPEGTPQAFYTIYGRRSADMQVWPFLRELAFSVTGRMDLPRLTLPLLINPEALDSRKKRRSTANRAE